MAAEEDESRDTEENLLDAILARAREQYVAEHGVEPPEDAMEDARLEVISQLARRQREKHRDVYDALADE